LAFAALPAISPAFGQEYVASNGRMSDEDFYRAVACGAAPGGGPCQKDTKRWDKPEVRVTIRRLDDIYLGGKRARAYAALERAVQAINAVDFGVTLVAVEGAADIDIYFINQETGSRIAGTDVPGVDGAVLGGATTRVRYSRETGAIRHAAIVFSTTLGIRAYESVMLEELTQAMGLMSDIKNPYYEGKSVFSEDSNDSKELGYQDVVALRRHYEGALEGR
jgi:hypothetical protein